MFSGYFIAEQCLHKVLDATSYETNKPYLNLAIINVLNTCFASGANSYFDRYRDVFKSSLSEKPQELEIPPAMLALAATTVWHRFLVALLTNTL